MSVEDSGVDDIVSVDRNGGHVVLTVSDHLDWSDSVAHQEALQKKLNTYLAFIESGEILERYPDARNRPVSLEVVFEFKPDRDGETFLIKARQVIESAGFQFRHKIFADSYDN